MAKNHNNAQSSSSQPKNLAEIVSYVKLFESVGAKEIEHLLGAASSFAVANDEDQKSIIAALKECVSAARTGRPARLSPQEHMRMLSLYAAAAFEQVVILAECHVEDLQGSLLSHAH
jgi:hypothetical protein